MRDKVKKRGKPFHSFKLVGDANGIHKHIFLDGEELEGCVRAVLVWEVDAVPTLHLDMVSLDIEADEQYGGYLTMKEDVSDASQRGRFIRDDVHDQGQRGAGMDPAGETGDGGD